MAYLGCVVIISVFQPGLLQPNGLEAYNQTSPASAKMNHQKALEIPSTTICL
jgi:hypothetical protein